ncbi:MAG TPA: GNAT family N-acetyltransferase [Gemmatimonadaceae bacterium]|nr:GNAT family N-acetyltransferase [Gemmatimonadaceae bacterium]
MDATVYREVHDTDLEKLAAIRAAEWGDEEYWRKRISGYASGILNPQQALPPRVIFVGAAGDQIVGFIAGHLTRRFACDGELEWLNVIPEQRRAGVARELLLKLAGWFADHGARRVCVDADPENPAARAFYRKNGAVDLNPHWLVWPDITKISSIESARSLVP